MEASDILDSLDTLIYSIASRCVVHVDELLLCTHPEPEAAEAGMLALLDLEQTGDQIIAEGAESIPVLADRIGWARAVGAALHALEESDDRELDLLRALITGARWIEEDRLGGPVDRHLRLALCVRAAALAAMGDPGEKRDSLAKRRENPADVLALEGYDFRIYTVLAHLPISDADRAVMAVRAAA